MSMLWTGSDWNELECARLHLILEFKLMGLELAVHLPGLFPRNFTGHIYIWPNVHSCCILVLLVLFAPCVCEPALANAERLVSWVHLHPQTWAPSGLCTTSLFVRIAPTVVCLWPLIYKCKHWTFWSRGNNAIGKCHVSQRGDWR